MEEEDSTTTTTTIDDEQLTRDIRAFLTKTDTHPSLKQIRYHLQELHPSHHSQLKNDKDRIKQITVSLVNEMNGGDDGASDGDHDEHEEEKNVGEKSAPKKKGNYSQKKQTKAKIERNYVIATDKPVTQELRKNAEHALKSRMKIYHSATGSSEGGKAGNVCVVCSAFGVHTSTTNHYREYLMELFENYEGEEGLVCSHCYHKVRAWMLNISQMQCVICSEVLDSKNAKNSSFYERFYRECFSHYKGQNGYACKKCYSTAKTHRINKYGCTTCGLQDPIRRYHNVRSFAKIKEEMRKQFPGYDGTDALICHKCFCECSHKEYKEEDDVDNETTQGVTRRKKARTEKSLDRAMKRINARTSNTPSSTSSGSKKKKWAVTIDENTLADALAEEEQRKKRRTEKLAREQEMNRTVNAEIKYRFLEQDVESNFTDIHVLANPSSIDDLHAVIQTHFENEVEVEDPVSLQAVYILKGSKETKITSDNLSSDLMQPGIKLVADMA